VAVVALAIGVGAGACTTSTGGDAATQASNTASSTTDTGPATASTVPGANSTPADGPLSSYEPEEGSDPSSPVQAEDPLLVPVVLAAEAIPAGMTGQDAIDQGLVKADAIPEKVVPRGALVDLEDLAGRTFAAFISPHQVIIEVMLEP